MWVGVTAVSLILWAAELRTAESQKECDKPRDRGRKRKLEGGLGGRGGKGQKVARAGIEKR